MWIFDADFVNKELAKPTSVFGLKLWVVIGICSGAVVVLLLVVVSLCVASRKKSSSQSLKRFPLSLPTNAAAKDSAASMSKDMSEAAAATALVSPQPSVAEIRVNIGKNEQKVVFGDYFGQHSQGLKQGGGSSGGTSGGSHRSGGDSASKSGGRPPEVSHLGWGHWYTLRELEEATNGLSPENVIGEGGYGIVYRGVLADNTVIAVKNLLNNRGQAEKEFKVEVEAIGRVRHKNLVRLLGYCVEGEYRMLVYEYVDNGNLDQWLNGNVGEVSPLTWEIRMNIILGTARGLAYLHEGLEPKVVHRDVKSSNILLDQHWNPRVSDFGLAKLLCSETNHVTTRVMGTFGYVAPEYASTGMLNERSDVYSFGVLIMELITGRAPVEYHKPPDEVHLVEWLKTMVGDRKCEEVLDPKIPARPSPKSLKRALLVALRCVDPDARKRPKMGHVIHMFELDQLLLHDDRKHATEGPGSHHIYSKRTLLRNDTNDTPSIWNCDQARDR